MMPMFTASLLARDPTEFSERDFQFEGTLLVCGDSAVLKFGENEADELEIIDSTFIDRILSSVPCYVGGECLYDDSVQFKGRISFREGKIVVELVESGELFREDEGNYIF